MRREACTAEPGVISLDSGQLRALIDPRHGAEIAKLYVSGRQVLSRTPWERRTPVPAANEAAWLRAWGGGWQILFPSAGCACEAGGSWQPFHGASSQAPWELRASSDATATLVWTADMWTLERQVMLSGNTVRVMTAATNQAASPNEAVAVEHLTFGDGLLAAGPVHLHSGPCEVQALTGDGAPIGTAHQWPTGPDHDDWSQVPVVGPASRFGSLTNLTDTLLTLCTTDLELQVRWDPSLPFLWYWLELDATPQPPWNRSTRALGLEPASYPHSLGLAAACQDGSARLVEPGETWSWFVDITVVHPRPSGKEART